LPKYSKKDYELVTDILGKNCVEPISDIVNDFIKVFEVDNEKFDRYIFIQNIIKKKQEACKVKGLKFVERKK